MQISSIRASHLGVLIAVLASAACGSTAQPVATSPATSPPDQIEIAIDRSTEEPATEPAAAQPAPVPTIEIIETVPTTQQPVVAAIEEPAETTPTVDPEPEGFVWRYGDFFEVPQLGSNEAVRGTACGGRVPVGEVVPDGIWYGNVAGEDAGLLTIDLRCVYYGASAQPFINDYLAETPLDDRIDYDASFWVVNNSDRRRLLPTAPGFTHRKAVPSGAGCIDPGPAGDGAPFGNQANSSWVVIERGLAVFMLTACDRG